MVFVPVSWPDYEMACLTQRGHAAIGVTHAKRLRLLARDATTRVWRVLEEWPLDRLSHTDALVHLGAHPEPETAEEVLELLRALARA